jgi:hypothetical protein
MSPLNVTCDTKCQINCPSYCLIASAHDAEKCLVQMAQCRADPSNPQAWRSHGRSMSACDPKRTSHTLGDMSASGGKADIRNARSNVCFIPKADVAAFQSSLAYRCKAPSPVPPAHQKSNCRTATALILDLDRSVQAADIRLVALPLSGRPCCVPFGLRRAGATLAGGLNSAKLAELELCGRDPYRWQTRACVRIRFRG